MQIINPPSNEQLNILQNELDKEENVGIVDIYGSSISLSLIAEENDSILGVVRIAFQEGNDSAEIYKLYVAPSHRGKGVSTFMLKRAIEILVKQDAIQLFIESTDNSLSFWEHYLSKCKFEFERNDYNKFTVSIGN